MVEIGASVFNAPAAQGLVDPRACGWAVPLAAMSGGTQRQRRKALGSSKRQTTMAKLTRERKVKEKRELKQEKKEAARIARAAGETVETDEMDETPPAPDE